ncbi:MAG: tetratricopeptide repeat protein [Candidatus Eisenbacteria bacterium]|nr:tetratricopeptide repeat protein [Candidatus Eisenbacteria bacterium]
MEKAIEIKRRAQRCIQTGDLDGALSEYEKLTQGDDSEPINFVLLADLCYKKGAVEEASRRYLQAVDAYERQGLYKNAIAVCKKMMRLSLSPTLVLQRLAQLHALDGFSTEAALYHHQYAEVLSREEKYSEAADVLRKAFEVSPENVRTLEKVGETLALSGDLAAAAAVLMEASGHHRRAGRTQDAERAVARAEQLHPGASECYRERVAEAPASGRETRSAPEPAPRTERRRGPAAADEPAGPAAPVRDAAACAPAVVEAAGVPAAESASEVTPPPEGLRFGSPAGPAPAAAEDVVADLAGIESLLQEAAARFRDGDRDGAGGALVRAARSYEALGKADSAAAIYRSLSRSAHASTGVLELWHANCEGREDRKEAAEVACLLGDHALNDDDLARARAWFERARTSDPENELAQRRLQRLAAAMPPPAAADDAAPTGKVEVALGRAEAVSFDMAALIVEFQRGVQAQLSDDAQSHYDLGMTYREMGLHDQALESFRLAARDPAFGPRCAEMIGRCLLDQGRLDEAVSEFTTALETLGSRPEVETGLRFQLGLVHEAAGRPQDALAQFERVYAMQANYPDVALKIRVLRRTLESV